MTFSSTADSRHDRSWAANTAVAHPTPTPPARGEIGPTKRWAASRAIDACLIAEHWWRRLRSAGPPEAPGDQPGRVRPRPGQGRSTCLS
jgi:hypothetical protein